MPLLNKIVLPKCITADVLRQLNEYNIQTVEDLLFTKKRSLISEILDKDVAENLLTAVEEAYAAPMMCALEIFRNRLANTLCFSTGCIELDELLGGGVYTGELLEIVGQVSSGKTQLCMQIALQATRYKSEEINTRLKVAYIDSTNSFSPTRLSELFNATTIPGIDELTISDVLQQINYFKVFNAFSLFNTLDQLNTKLDAKDEDLASSLRLIVIDSFGTLVAPTLSSKQHMGRGLLTEISRLIKKLAQNHNIAIVVTNYAVTGKDDTLKPGLGEAWSYAPHAQIMLRYSGVVENGNKILEAKLTRSSRNETGKFINFTITSGGIRCAN